jgi:hypothetical protein
VTWSLSLRGKLQWFDRKLMTSLGLVHICLRFGEREESRLYKDLVTILENLHIRRYVSVSIKVIYVLECLPLSASCHHVKTTLYHLKSSPSKLATLQS